jgi:hypothetical protein
MTPDKLKKILAEYQAVLRPGERMPALVYPVRASLEQWQEGTVEGHIHWMCQEAQTFLEKNKVEKALRWLGFIQGVLWCLGYKSLDDLRDDSRPDEEPFRNALQKEFEETVKNVRVPPESFVKQLDSTGNKPNKDPHQNKKERG